MSHPTAIYVFPNNSCAIAFVVEARTLNFQAEVSGDKACFYDGLSSRDFDWLDPLAEKFSGRIKTK